MFKKIAIPVIIGLLLASAVIALFLACYEPYLKPENVAARYISACMLQNTDDMIKYSSAYNKAYLNGGSMPTDKSLKEKLDSVYAEADSVYKGADINFSVTSVRTVDVNSKEYEDFYLEYSRIADASKISEVCFVQIQVYADGLSVLNSSCYLAKINGRWRYAFQPTLG